MMKLSLIIPCYNESKNLSLLLSRCEEVAAKENNIEIVIVDNGSTDNTSIILDELTSNLPFITKVRVEVNQGYGHGILAGLEVATGEILGWTHADMQTDPGDALKGLDLFRDVSTPEQLFVKGKRYGRPIADIFFTIGMAIFETIFLRRLMWDINAQPTIFHREFFLTWDSPPDDFSLDLYAYYMAIQSGLKIKRFPVIFSERAYGISHWNVNFTSKYRFIKRTLIYSFGLHRRMKKNA
jgi:glycosyltransferase involved in cell wall biosynthesis